MSLQQRANALVKVFIEENPQSLGIKMRLDLSRLLLDAMKEKGWSQSQLARASGKSESFISRVINANSNCTFEVAGELMFALGIRDSDMAIVRTPRARLDSQIQSGVLASIEVIQLTQTEDSLGEEEEINTRIVASA